MKKQVVNYEYSEELTFNANDVTSGSKKEWVTRGKAAFPKLSEQQLSEIYDGSKAAIVEAEKQAQEGNSDAAPVAETPTT
jgi:hypothetical protein